MSQTESRLLWDRGNVSEARPVFAVLILAMPGLHCQHWLEAVLA